jgi:hypothetical protein
MKYCSDHIDKYGLDTLYDVVVNKVPFDGLEHDLVGASEVALHALHTLFDLEFGEDERLLGKSKLSMQGLFGDLCLSLERMAIFQDGQADEWCNA